VGLLLACGLLTSCGGDNGGGEAAATTITATSGPASTMAGTAISGEPPTTAAGFSGL
jgi:hypothetical protein